MNTSQLDNDITIKLLKALGRRKPTPEQVDLANKLFSRVTVQQQLSFSNHLTKTEIYCLILAAKGLTTPKIAEILNVKKPTVQTHRKNILRKLSCSTFPEAVLKGIQFGYILPSFELIHKTSPI